MIKCALQCLAKLLSVVMYRLSVPVSTRVTLTPRGPHAMRGNAAKFRPPASTRGQTRGPNPRDVPRGKKNKTVIFLLQNDV